MRERLSWDYDKVAAAALRREISDGFKYNKKKLKHLKQILHNITVAQGTLVSALNIFSRVKGRDISPDGMLGGLGYIMPLRSIKESLIQSIQQIGDIADCLADELTNPKWNAEDDTEVKKLIKEKEEVEEQAEEEVEEGIEEGITPDDVITSTEKVANLSANMEKTFALAVRDHLTRICG